MSRWLSETGGSSGEDYAARFAALEAQGKDLHGEARYVDGLLPAGSRVLDAGCGTGRVAVELARRGHLVTGVDNDASMLAVAQRSPGVTWVLGDLATLDLGEQYDLVLTAGNVMVFLAPGTEQQVVERLAAHVRPGGLLVSGWRTDLMQRSTYDSLVSSLEPVVRHSTWDAEPWVDDAGWCVAVDRVPSGPAGP